jgi:hypothetical protein
LRQHSLSPITLTKLLELAQQSGVAPNDSCIVRATANNIVEIRGNLSSAYFPLVSQYHGRTVIVSGQDNNFNRQLYSSADNDKDIGIPQMYYGHNIMPTGTGFLSVGFEQRVPAVDGTNKGNYST